MQHKQPKVMAYCRVSTEEQASSGLGMAAQLAAIEGEALKRGWVVEWHCDDGFSAKDLRRPALARLLFDISAGDVLVVAKLDRLSRSLMDFAALMERSTQRGLESRRAGPRCGHHDGCRRDGGQRDGELRPVRASPHRRTDAGRSCGQEGRWASSGRSSVYPLRREGTDLH